jgi:hypothetical protein
MVAKCLLNMPVSVCFVCPVYVYCSASFGSDRECTGVQKHGRAPREVSTAKCIRLMHGVVCTVRHSSSSSGSSSWRQQQLTVVAVAVARVYSELQMLHWQQQQQQKPNDGLGTPERPIRNVAQS